jgi:tellurite resistance protein TerC
MTVSSELWAVSIGVLIAAFAVDFIAVDAKGDGDKPFGTKQALRWVLVYVCAALLFSVFVWSHFGAEFAKQFLAGWITEYSLSVDNLFVFIVMMSSFAVPAIVRHRVLLLGVAIAIILRGVLIVLGAAAISRFAATFFVFGGFLLYTAITVWRSGEEEPDPEGNALVRRLERTLPVTAQWHSTHMTAVIDAKRFLTPMFLVTVAVGTTDLLFALDSIPAVFGLTQEPYLVLAANAFALMGLRQLFFLLDGLLEKVIYLSKGLAIILGFIALKLLFHASHEVLHWHTPEIGIGSSLGVIAVTLAVTVIVSLRAVAKNPSLSQHSEASEVEDIASRNIGRALDDVS